MAFALHLLFLLCGISGVFTGAWTLQSFFPGCPKGWTQLDQRCYIYQDHEMTFLEAEKVCTILGGNLVSIRDVLENAVILQLVRKGNDPAAWIGLHDAILDMDFVWTDGTQVKFTAFRGGDPVDIGNCVQISAGDGFWDDVVCDAKAPYVCIQDVNFCGSIEC